MWMYESMGKISNITNSNDPQMVNSRVFCGNLNTFTLTKDDVEAIFKRYGRIIGISMHKGYAFVQYTNEYDARNAVAGEDQRIYAGQPVDVNMASEPKPNRPSRKRPQGAGSEWDYYYNAGTLQQATLSPTLPAGPGLAHREQVAPPFLKRPHPDLLDLEDFTFLSNQHSPVAPRGLVPPPMKRLRPEHIPPIKMPGHLKRNLVPLPGNAAAAAAMMKGRILVPRLRMAKTMKTGIPIKMVPRPSEQGEYESPDILICGTCKQTFPELDKLMSHKQTKCKLRFLCRCNEDSIKHLGDLKNGGDPTTLSCATCNSAFSSSWELCQHVQTEHGLQIYVLPPNTNNAKCENSTSSKDDAESTADDKASQSLDDVEAVSTDLTGDVDGEILGMTADGTPIVLADDADVDDDDVENVTDEDALLASATINNTEAMETTEGADGNCDDTKVDAHDATSGMTSSQPVNDVAETCSGSSSSAE